MKRILLSALAALLCCAAAYAAGDDTETDASYGAVVDVDWKVAKGLHLNAETEARMQDAWSNMERWTLCLGTDYRLTSWLKAEMGYEFLNRYKPSHLTSAGNTLNGYWSPRHRWKGGLSGQLKVGRWELSLRERYQYTYAPLQYVPKYQPDGKRLTDEAKEDSHEHLLRSRLQAKYNIRHCKFTPAASLELHNDLSEGMSLSELRYVVGGDYKLDKHNSLLLHCRYEQHMNEGSNDAVVILLGYSYSF